ncbi:MAG: hypothetical protein K5650_04390 [Bacteroidales bacterium]|nr:hypothetical protein [Bacteroidales bacterium]
MSIIIDTSWYYVPLCLALGAAYAAALYYIATSREQRQAMSRGTRLCLAALRFVSVSAIALLLLAPTVKHTAHEREKPVVAVAYDRSQSTMLTADSSYYRTTFASDIESLTHRLEADYEVALIPFGDQTTDIADALSQVRERYAGRNLGALVLATDGIYNQGSNPTAAARELGAPIYCIAMGDTTVRCDAAVADVRMARTVLLGSRFPVEVTLRADHLQGQHRTLKVEHRGHTIATRTLTFADDRATSVEAFELEAKEAGLQSFTFTLSPATGEASEANNRRTVTVEVIDNRQKVAIVYAAPHPDVAALVQAIGANPAYEVQTIAASDFTGPASLHRGGYSVAIFHNLPNDRTDLKGLPDDMPALFILGSQTNLPRFNALHTGLSIVTKISKTTEALPVWNDAFTLFALSPEDARRVEQWPPLSAPFGDYRTTPAVQTLFTARLGQVASRQPLVTFATLGAARRGIVAGEGLWRWRMADYRLNGSHSIFDALIGKMLTLTAMQTRREQFSVEAQTIYRTGEPVTLRAVLYNDSYEPINTPDATLVLSGSQQAEYSMGRSGTGYSLTLPPLPAGHYGYEGRTILDGRRLVSRGSFAVEELALEELSLTANHTLLRTMAKERGGALIEPADIASLPALIADRGDVKPVIYSHTRHSALVGMPWLLVAIVLLLGTEWIIRKLKL